MASIRPGISLGFFKLGASLQSVLQTLRSCPLSAFPKIQVIYSNSDPTGFPIILLLEANGIRLQFDGQEQYLRLIEVLEYGKTKVLYKNNELGKHGSLTFRSIYSKVFGPTYPGIYDSESSEYILSYPGIAFTFKIPRDLKPFPESFDDFVKYLSGSSAPLCSATAIFRGHSWPEAKNNVFKPSYLLPNWRMETLHGEKRVVDVDYVETSPPSDTAKVVFKSHPQDIKEFTIKIGGTTMQDIIIVLGPPSERFFKQDSRLSIHNPRDGADGRTDLFFNYCSLGFDICFDTLKKNPPVKKLILHGNIPGSLPFQKYKRCRWRVDKDVTSEHKFTEYAERFIEDGKAMVLNRQLESPSSSVELVGTPDDPAIASVEDWGLTDLFGSPGCIFEVLKNGCVASLTIY